MFTILFDNTIICCIALLGGGIYQVLIYYLLRSYFDDYSLLSASWLEPCEKAIAVLPLLGLSGTIQGVTAMFRSIANKGDTFQLTTELSGAMESTQFALVVAIPAWLLLSYLKQLRLKHLHSKQE